jgi:hypothetical protein
MYVRE